MTKTNTKMDKVLLRAKKTNMIYAYLGNDKYENLTKGGTGKLSAEDAKNLFVIPMGLNAMYIENPLIIDLIQTAGLSIENI